MENFDAKKDARKEQLRRAQKKWRMKQKASNPAPNRVEPHCYSKEYRVAYHKTYYQKNRDRILNKIRSSKETTIEPLETMCSALTG